MQNYYTKTGKYQKAAEFINHLLPNTGELCGRGNAKLERYRKAEVYYHDLNTYARLSSYAGFTRMFGINPTSHIELCGNKTQYTKMFFSLVEHSMDKFIVEAIREQCGILMAKSLLAIDSNFVTALADYDIALNDC